MRSRQRSGRWPGNETRPAP